RVYVLAMLSTPTTATRFPYTTLFRSEQLGHLVEGLADRVVARLAEQRGRRVRLDAVQRRVSARDHEPQVGRHQLRIGELRRGQVDRKSTRLNSSHVKISYAVFCLKKK